MSPVAGALARSAVMHIFGASGTGASTLGRAVAETYGFTQLDTDDFYWETTDPPYQEARDIPARQQLMSTAMDQAGKCVVSGSLSGWGDVFIPRFDLVIYLITPTEIRVERLRNREASNFGGRIMPGGDMYEHHQDFLEWAAAYDDGGLDMRSARRHLLWLDKIPCPVLRLAGTSSCEENLARIEPYLI